MTSGGKVAVIQFPGTNCERETARVLRAVLDQPVDTVWHASENALESYECVVLPGGFAHGDHLRAGAIARFSPIMAAVERFARGGGLVLGICNGFQVLLEAGLLPGAMMQNANRLFTARWVECRVERTDTPFTRAFQSGEVIRLPIAHGEGNYVLPAPQDVQPRVVMRYCDAQGLVSAQSNPNGSADNIACLVSSGGNVLGLMPHPERASEALLGGADGRRLFESIALSLRDRQKEPAIA